MLESNIQFFRCRDTRIVGLQFILRALENIDKNFKVFERKKKKIEML